MQGKTVIVGAGIVGICTAIELQQKGYCVTIVEKESEVNGASWGNAGVVSPGSIIPVATPALTPKIPKLLLNRSRDFHYHAGQLATMRPLLRHILRACEPSIFEANVKSLHALAKRAMAQHSALMERCNTGTLYADSGWLHLFRTEAGFQRGKTTLEILDQYSVDFDVLGGDDICALEPALKPVFHSGIWIREANAVRNPGKVCERFLNYFLGNGGKILRSHVQKLQPDNPSWRIITSDEVIEANHVVICAGAHTPKLLKKLGCHLPVYPERGYHQHYQPEDSDILGRPFYDVETGYVVSPMEYGLRVSTGIEWAGTDDEPTPVQLGRVIPKARQALDIGIPKQFKPWLGSRPQTPDSPSYHRQNRSPPRIMGQYRSWAYGILFRAFVRKLFSQLFCGEPTDIDLSAYRLARFNNRRKKR